MKVICMKDSRFYTRKGFLYKKDSVYNCIITKFNCLVFSDDGVVTIINKSIFEEYFIFLGKYRKMKLNKINSVVKCGHSG